MNEPNQNISHEDASIEVNENGINKPQQITEEDLATTCTCDKLESNEVSDAVFEGKVVLFDLASLFARSIQLHVYNF